jgi:cell division protein ZapE
MFTDIYQKAIEEQQLSEDASQRVAVAEFQRLYHELANDNSYQPAFFNRLKQSLLGRPAAAKGIYLWGGVGRGKTLLMNMFYQALPFAQKTRKHFHHFMLDVHAQLAKLQQQNSSNKQRQKNPLEHVARYYAQQYRIICLDEFIVTNITDAMLLYGLLDALFKQGVVIVATSNRVPDDLYLNGLQRDRFLPAIELIKQHMHVLHLDSDVDHRLELLEQSHIYHTPLSAQTQQKLQQQFAALAVDAIEHDRSITIQQRDIKTVALSDELIWFDFDVLCSAPRATPDYIDIAGEYQTVMLSNVPVMNADMDDRARRFIYLIDELYDKNVILIMSAATNVDELYQGTMLAFAFRRTRSRLIEMRSEQYLQKSETRRLQP